MKMEKLSPEDFEFAQLRGRLWFCRRCGAIDGLAVVMDHIDVLHLDAQTMLGEAGSFHVYQCPRCSHRGMSEALMMEESDAARCAELIAQEMRDNAAQAAEYAQTLALEHAWEWEAVEPDPDSDYQDELVEQAAAPTSSNVPQQEAEPE